VDDPDAVKAMRAKLGFNYPVLTGTPDEMLGLMRSLGNEAGGLPFSVLIGPDGAVLDRQLGQLVPVEIAALMQGQVIH